MSISEPIDLSDAVWLRSELLAEGHTDHELRALVRSGALHRVRHGSYVDGDLWRRLSNADRHRVLVRAVLRRAHPSTVITHVSAAVERGTPVWGVPLDEVHVTRSDGRPGRREAGVVHHAGVLPAEHVTTVNGVKVSSAARCAVEVASLTTIEPALVTVNSMLNQGQVTLAELETMVDELKHWPATISTTLLLRLCDGRLESVGETRTAHLCWSQHLPRPVPQLEIFDEQGRFVARVDFAWPELGVFLEFDGRQKYEQFRRRGESLEDFLLREKRREELVCQITGWVCIRITWRDLEQPELTARRIRRILESRRPAGA